MSLSYEKVSYWIVSDKYRIRLRCFHTAARGDASEDTHQGAFATSSRAAWPGIEIKHFLNKKKPLRGVL